MCTNNSGKSYIQSTNIRGILISRTDDSTRISRKLNVREIKYVYSNVPIKQTWLEKSALPKDIPVYRSGVANKTQTRDLRNISQVRYPLRYQDLFHPFKQFKTSPAYCMLYYYQCGISFSQNNESHCS